MSIEQTTLRDQLSAAFDAAPEVDQSATASNAETASASAESQVDTRTASERARDEQGRFARKAEESQQREQQAAQQGQGQGESGEQQIKQRPGRPSTWKKDVAERFWDQLDPELADYINLREQQYAQGVSTYKQEWERVKPLNDALQPYMPLLQQHGVDPAQWISSLGEAQRVLAFGSPEEKQVMLQQIAQQYGITLGGNSDPNVNAFLGELQRIKTDLNHFKTAAERAEQERTRSEIAGWSDGKPHFQKVRGTMAQLLESGVATDLDSAYDKAIRLHDDIFTEVQQERARAAEEERRQKAAQTVAQARANAVSVKGATPSSPGKTEKAKGLRAQLEAAADEHMASRF